MNLWQFSEKQVLQFSDNLQKDFPEILFAFLFGSIITKSIKKPTDIDVAIYLDRDKKTFQLISDIIRVTEYHFPEFPCDLIVLNDAGTDIRMEALKGKLLFVRQEALDSYSGFYSDTCRMYEYGTAWKKIQLKYRGYEVQWDN